MNPSTLKVQRLDQRARLPEYASDGAACFDLRCLDGAKVQPLTTATLRTGLAFEVPPGFSLLIFSRSGHGFKNDLRLANCIGVIDSDYRGEVLVKITSDSNVPFEFEAGDRIAQAALVAMPRAQLVEAAELSTTKRGQGGFGSTGTH